MRAPREEAIVIGSGAGGLFTAIFLSRLGWSVTVVEKNRRPGGLIRGYLRDGIECAVGVHYLGALDTGQPLRRIFDLAGLDAVTVPLERMGDDGVVDRYIFDDFTFDLPVGIEAFENRLRAAAPGQDAQTTAIVANLRAAQRRMQTLGFVLDDRPDPGLIEQTRPLGGLLDQLGCSSKLRDVLSMTSAWMGVSIDECPIALHHFILASYLSSAWRLRRGGSHLAATLARRFEEQGGRLVLGDQAARVLVEDRRVTGVELASGVRLDAPLVIGALHPKVVLQLLPEGSVKPAYRKRITGLRDTRGAFCVQAALLSSPTPEHGFNILEQTPDPDDEAGRGITFYQLRGTDRPGESLLCILRSDHIERWVDENGQRKPGYAEQKQREALRLLDRARRHYGTLHQARILDAYTPVTIRDWVASPGGSAYGVLRSTRQRFQTALLNRTAVKGLYLAGQSVMAPGIFGTALGALRTVRLIAGAARTREAMGPIFES